MHSVRRFAAPILAAALALALAAPVPAQAEVYGTQPDLEVTTPVSDVLAAPADYLGKVVKVQGLVVDVCTSRGCWLELGGDKPFQSIRVKVEDGVIVFPLTARGKKAVVQGKLEALEMDAEHALRFRRHQAAEKGVAFDPASASGPLTVYQIRPTGVVIE